MKKTESNTIKVPVNNGFYGLSLNDGDYSNEHEKESQEKLEKIYKGEHTSFIVRSTKDFEKAAYQNVKTVSFRSRDDFSEQRLIYEVKKSSGKYYLATGLYVGYLNIDGIRIEINTGYNKCLLARMLNVANNIYFDSSSNENVGKTNSVDEISVIIKYLFLTNFKKAFSMGLPSSYKRFEEKGLNIKGNVDIKKYITKDISLGHSISYSYNQRVFSQDVIDVLYLAIKCCLDFPKEKETSKKQTIRGNYC